jgi:hypothetical protein
MDPLGDVTAVNPLDDVIVMNESLKSSRMFSNVSQNTSIQPKMTNYFVF